MPKTDATVKTISYTDKQLLRHCHRYLKAFEDYLDKEEENDPDRSKAFVRQNAAERALNRMLPGGDVTNFERATLIDIAQDITRALGDQRDYDIAGRF